MRPIDFDALNLFTELDGTTDDVEAVIARRMIVE